MQVAKSRLQNVVVAVQSALAEADYWVDLIDGHLQTTAAPLTAKDQEPIVRQLMLPWLQAVARRAGGMCLGFGNESAAGAAGWGFCASREARADGAHDLFWGRMPDAATVVKARVAAPYDAPLSPAASRGVGHRPFAARAAMRDGERVWRPPWVGEEPRPDGTRVRHTRVGQQMLRERAGVRTWTAAWLQDPDWPRLLRDALAAPDGPDDAAAPEAAAFLFAASGRLVAATCGRTRPDAAEGGPPEAQASDCALVADTYRHLNGTGALAQDYAFERALIGARPLLIGVQRVTTQSGDRTPYFVALAYGHAGVDRPVQASIWTMGLVSCATLLVGVLGASMASRFCLAKPLERLSRQMLACVKLENLQAARHAPQDGAAGGHRHLGVLPENEADRAGSPLFFSFLKTLPKFSSGKAQTRHQNTSYLAKGLRIFQKSIFSETLLLPLGWVWVIIW